MDVLYIDGQNVQTITTPSLLFEVWARNLQLVKEQPAKVGQDGDLMSPAKMKMRRELVGTWRVELPLIPGGGQDFQEDDRPSGLVLEFLNTCRG
jgi:hypothetical protein